MWQTARKEFLGSKGINADKLIFDGKGGYECRFALAGIPGLNYVEGSPNDPMHNLLQGKVIHWHGGILD